MSRRQLKELLREKKRAGLAFGIFLLVWAVFGVHVLKKGPEIVLSEVLMTPLKTPGATHVLKFGERGPATGSKSVSELEQSIPKDITGCFTQNYQHQPTPGHTDRESCAQHANVVTLDPAIHALCVRVDGVPVAYERKKEKILIGPLAGPDSVVSVSYCLGKSTCQTPCQIPRDGFMSAIGAGEDAEPQAPAVLVNWDPGDTDSARDVTAGIDEGDEHPKEKESKHALSQFKDWTPSAKRPGCSTTLVSVL